MGQSACARISHSRSRSSRSRSKSPPAVSVCATRARDIPALAAQLRPQDALELDAAGWQGQYEHVVRSSVEQSLWALTVHVHGELACVFGVVAGGTLLTPTGVPWMLGTDVVPRSARVLQRMAPAYIAAMLLEFPRLSNTVHARNTVAVRWLRRLGFTLGQTFAHPITREPFIPFRRSRGDV